MPYYECIDRQGDLLHCDLCSAYTVMRAGNGPHQPDQSRSEDDAVQSYGVDDRGSIRDWNEEIQRCVHCLILPASKPFCSSHVAIAPC
jgi:hypothetical protein